MELLIPSLFVISRMIERNRIAGTLQFYVSATHVTLRFTKLLTSGFRNSFEITEVRYELGNFILYLSIKL